MKRNAICLPSGGCRQSARHAVMACQSRPDFTSRKCVTRHAAVQQHFPSFLSSAPVGSEWTASRPCRFTPGERAPCTHWTGGWVGPRVCLDGVDKSNTLQCRESNPGRSACGTSPYQPSCADPLIKKTPSPESASDRHLSARLVPTFFFEDRGSNVVSVTDPFGRIL
jgi:hypothetical protein